MRIEPFSFQSLNSNGTFEPLARSRASDAMNDMPGEPAFTQQDITAAESNGFVKGYNEGMAAGLAQMQMEQRERESATLAIVQVMVRRIEEMVTQHQDFLTQQSEKMGELSLAIARKVAGDSLVAQPAEVIEPMVLECLQMFVGQPKFVISTHPDLVKVIQEKIEQQSSSRGISATLAFQANPQLPLGDCRIEWPSGHAQLRQAEVWKEIESIIKTRPAATVASADHELLQGAARLPGNDETNESF